MARPQPATDSEIPLAAAPAGVPASGRVIGDFHLLRLLGRGGMAEVWLAEQASLKRHVALKLLKPELMSDPSYVKRFQSEAKAAAGLSHHNIVQIFSIGEVDGVHFISQEYVQGPTLKAFLKKRGALDVQTALHIMRQAAGALQAASERGIVHRDIKPENIMLTRKGDVKIADFGLAQLMGGERLDLTQEGTTMGTPLYMSPEQVNGEKVDPRSDIYSLGVTFYHMLAGETPFRGDTAIAVGMQHLKAPVPDLVKRRSDIPREMCDIVHKMLEKSPQDRYQNVPKILTDLRKVMRLMRDAGQLDSIEMPLFDATEPPPSLPVRRPWLVLPLVGLLVGLASAGVGWWRRPPVPPSQGPQIVDQGSAEKQFRWALMQVDNEDAFKSVKVNYPHDTIWTPMSDEQLTLLYLKDVSNPQRQKAIQSQIENLRGHGPHANKFAIEAAIAQAYVQVHEGKFLLANQTLVTSGLPAMPPNPESIQGTWRMYLQQVQQEIFQGLRTGEGLGSDRRDDRPAGNRRPDAKNVTSPGDS